MPNKQLGYTVKENRFFFALLMQNGTSFYIGHTAAKNGPRTAYMRHRRGLNIYTQKYFLGAEPGNLPGMYKLEDFKCTRADAYKRMLAWVALLTSEGYECLSGELFSFDAAHLEGVTQKYFAELQQRFPEGCGEIFAPDQNLFANYGTRKQRPENDDGDDKILTLRISRKEYDALSKSAADQGMTMNKYCRSRLVNRNVIHVDYHFLIEHLQTYDEVAEDLKSILLAIYQTQNYYPADLENIQRLIDKVSESAEVVRKAYRKNMSNLNRKLIANIADDLLAEEDLDGDPDEDEE